MTPDANDANDANEDDHFLDTTEQVDTEGDQGEESSQGQERQVVPPPGDGRDGRAVRDGGPRCDGGAPPPPPLGFHVLGGDGRAGLAGRDGVASPLFPWAFPPFRLGDHALGGDGRAGRAGLAGRDGRAGLAGRDGVASYPLSWAFTSFRLGDHALGGDGRAGRDVGKQPTHHRPGKAPIGQNKRPKVVSPPSWTRRSNRKDIWTDQEEELLVRLHKKWGRHHDRWQRIGEEHPRGAMACRHKFNQSQERDDGTSVGSRPRSEAGPVLRKYLNELNLPRVTPASPWTREQDLALIRGRKYHHNQWKKIVSVQPHLRQSRTAKACKDHYNKYKERLENEEACERYWEEQESAGRDGGDGGEAPVTCGPDLQKGDGGEAPVTCGPDLQKRQRKQMATYVRKAQEKYVNFVDECRRSGLCYESLNRIIGSVREMMLDSFEIVGKVGNAEVGQDTVPETSARGEARSREREARAEEARASSHSGFTPSWQDPLPSPSWIIDSDFSWDEGDDDQDEGDDDQDEGDYNPDEGDDDQDEGDDDSSQGESDRHGFGITSAMIGQTVRHMQHTMLPYCGYKFCTRAAVGLGILDVPPPLLYFPDRAKDDCYVVHSKPYYWHTTTSEELYRMVESGEEKITLLPLSRCGISDGRVHDKGSVYWSQSLGKGNVDRQSPPRLWWSTSLVGAVGHAFRKLKNKKLVNVRLPHLIIFGSQLRDVTIRPFNKAFRFTEKGVTITREDPWAKVEKDETNRCVGILSDVILEVTPEGMVEIQEFPTHYLPTLEEKTPYNVCGDPFQVDIKLYGFNRGQTEYLVKPVEEGNPIV